MDPERQDYADPAAGPDRPWLRTAVLLLAAATLVGVGVAGALAYFLIRDHF
jgi:hypothetical protein